MLVESVRKESRSCEERKGEGTLEVMDGIQSHRSKENMSGEQGELTGRGI